MAIQREDLVAAAALGLLQYRQIDPLLIFLLQRDVRSQREAMWAQGRSMQARHPYALLSCAAGAAALVTAAVIAL